MKSVLLVEDNDDWRELAAEVLTSEGYSVTQARNGREGLVRLASLAREPCLVLLDMMMPEMNGADFMRVLEQTHRLASLPVVVLSAHAEAPDVPGARQFCRKPVDLDVLLGVVRDFCGEP